MIRDMKLTDKEDVLSMMRVFYSSKAVWTNGSEEIYANDIEECVGESPYAKGYIFEIDNEIAGYVMIAISYSTEFGKRCIWIEDIYIKDRFRGKGIGRDFFNYITKKYYGSIFKLEVEKENEPAMGLYRKQGFENLPYIEMIRQ